MASRQSLYQSLATSGAVLIVFIGVCHEVVGTRLFPFHVLPWALVVAAAGIVVTAFTAIVHHGFHLFAITIVLAAASTAYCHRAALTTQDG